MKPAAAATEITNKAAFKSKTRLSRVTCTRASPQAVVSHISRTMVDAMDFVIFIAAVYLTTAWGRVDKDSAICQLHAPHRNATTTSELSR
jgi:hypothetical protein